MADTTEKPPVRRSGRRRGQPPPFIATQEILSEAAEPLAIAGTDQEAKGNQKRRLSPDEAEEESMELGADSKQQQVQLRYYCPIPGCTYSLATARSLKDHYNDNHDEVADKETWNTRLALTRPHSEWLEEKERQKAGKKGRGKGKRKGTGKKTKNDGKPLRRLAAQQTPQAHSQSATDGSPASAFRAREPPAQSQPPTTATAIMIPIAALAAAINKTYPSSPQPAKRRRLNDLLDGHKEELQSFIDQELQEAHERADNAEAKLQSLITEKAAEVPSDAQMEVHRLTTERARSKEEAQKMIERIRKLEKEVEDDRTFSTSTRLKEAYRRQAKAEARIALKLDPNLFRPEPVNGGFL